MNTAYALLALPAAALYAFRWTWWKKDLPGLPALCYHKIGTPPRGSRLKELWVSPEKFAKQLDWLNKKGYRTLLFSELLQIREGKEKFTGKELLITFDDGYENNYLQAWPVLREKGAKANIFVVYNTVGKTNVWHNPGTEPWINMADQDMLLEMQESGFVEYGSHTMNHPKLEKIPAEDAKWEIEESKLQLEKLFKRKLCAFAYPYGIGAYNEKIRKFVLDAGYTFDFSFKQGKTPWPWDREARTIDRLFIKKNDSLLDLALHIKKGFARLW